MRVPNNFSESLHDTEMILCGWAESSDLQRCFGKGAQGADALMEALSRCRDLEDRLLCFECGG